MPLQFLIWSNGICIPIYFMDYVFKIFWFCLFVVIEQKFKGGSTLYVYVHIFRFTII